MGKQTSDTQRAKMQCLNQFLQRQGIRYKLQYCFDRNLLNNCKCSKLRLIYCIQSEEDIKQRLYSHTE